jgi:hypothetical protein
MMRPPNLLDPRTAFGARPGSRRGRCQTRAPDRQTCQAAIIEKSTDVSADYARRGEVCTYPGRNQI